MAFVKKFFFEMTDDEKMSMKKWKQEDHRLWRKWIYQEMYRKLEYNAITTHKQPCNCLDCRVYRQRVRIRCQRPVIRKPREK